MDMAVPVSPSHAHGIEYKPKHAEEKDGVYSPFTFPSVKLSIEERVAIFHSLFKGREDVFARRWFSKTTGKSGYQPVCINEWRRGVCDKKKYKCADCPNRHFAPLTYQDLYRHLEGKDENCCDVVGLYAIMPDNNCTFLCTDFDDKSCKYGYKDDVLAFVGVCKEWNIPYAIERSRSGNGALPLICLCCRSGLALLSWPGTWGNSPSAREGSRCCRGRPQIRHLPVCFRGSPCPPL